MPYAILAALGLLVTGYVWSRIFWKAGWGQWTGVLMLVPIVNVVMLVMLAFGRWPVHDRLEQMENELRELREDR